MMADLGKESIFWAMSKSETDADIKDNDTDAKFKTAYALFRCRKQGSETSQADDASHQPGAQIKKSSASNYSIEKLLSSLDGADEVELTNFITRKLSKGALQNANGSISAIDLRLDESQPNLYLAYYCLLKETKPSPVEVVTPDELASLGLDGISVEVNSAEPDSSDDVSELLVCLIAPADSQLDLFKPDLDQFCHQLLAKLEFELFLLFDLEETEETNDVVTIAKPLLDSWFDRTTSYVSRCVQCLGSDIRYLIHAALTDARIEIHCVDKSLQSDIERFFEVCSLSGLLSSNSKDDHPGRSSPHSPGGDGALLIDLDTPVKQATKSKATVTIKIDSEGCTFENKGCTKYCEEWSRALEICNPESHAELRVVIENYKLKAIQDMNTLKRLLKQAESDYYALYRCYIFLKQCGNAPVLLQHAHSEICEMDDLETAQVLNVLQEQLAQGAALSRR